MTCLSFINIISKLLVIPTFSCHDNSKLVTPCYTGKLTCYLKFVISWIFSLLAKNNLSEMCFLNFLDSLEPVYNGPSTDSLLSVYVSFFFFILHFFHVVVFSCCTFSFCVALFVCRTFFLLQFFHFTLFLSNNLFRLLFSCFFFPVNIFSMSCKLFEYLIE